MRRYSRPRVRAPASGVPTNLLPPHPAAAPSSPGCPGRPAPAWSPRGVGSAPLRPRARGRGGPKPGPLDAFGCNAGLGSAAVSGQSRGSPTGLNPLAPSPAPQLWGCKLRPRVRNVPRRPPGALGRCGVSGTHCEDTSKRTSRSSQSASSTDMVTEARGGPSPQRGRLSGASPAPRQRDASVATSTAGPEVQVSRR